MLAFAWALPAQAAEYFAANGSELAARINEANTNGDTNAIIKLTASFDAGNLPKPNNNITIDTQGFTLSGIDNIAPLGDGGDITFNSGTGGVMTLVGAFVGGDAGGAAANGGGSALNLSSGTQASTIVNNGSLTGGAGSSNTPGGVAVSMNVTNFTNNGTITGGGNTLGWNGNTGAQVRRGSTLTNNINGLIQGGTSLSSSGGTGVDIGGLGAASTLINHGTIRGATGATTGGIGVIVRAGTNPITNTGTIEGGNGAKAVMANANASLSITNSGTIRAGTGQADAISLSTTVTTGFLTLELQQGSEIIGNVVANATATTDILRLGGDENSTFDASAIGTQYQNFNNFEKTGASTWTLTGTTTALTPWQLKGGTLAVSSDGALGDAAGALTFDGGALRALSSFTSTRNMVFTGNGVFDVDAGAELTLSGSLTGAGGLRKLGAGTLIQNSAVGYLGATSVENGTLRAGGAGVFSGDYSISAVTGATLDLDGFDQTIGALSNGGTLRFGETPGTTLTVGGNYVGNGGTVFINTVLGDDNSDTDLLRVDGTTSGNTLVRVTNVGGAGAQTNEGIKVIDVGGSSGGTFALIGDTVVNGQQAVLGGAFAYSLYQGSVSAPDDGDWYLRSLGFSPSASSYEAYPAILLGLIDMPTFQQRIGNSYMPNAGRSSDGYVNPEPAADVGPEPVKLANFWTRIEGATGHYEGKSDTGTEYDLDRYRVQVGIDGRLGESEDGILIAGISAQYGHADADLESDSGDGSNKTDSYGGGLSLTWLGTSGFYADAQAMAHYLESDLKSAVLGDLVEDNEGWGYGLSLELGRKLALDDVISITPQAQLAYTSVEFDDFTDGQGVDVSLDKGESLKGRLGVALGFDSTEGGDGRGHVYTIANLTYEFLDAQSVDVAGTDVEFEPEDFGGELGLGGSYEWAEGKYAVHGEALGQTSFEGSYGIKGSAGFSVKF